MKVDWIKVRKEKSQFVSQLKTTTVTFKDSYFIRMTPTVLLTGPCVSKNLPMLFLSLLKSMG